MPKGKKLVPKPEDVAAAEKGGSAEPEAVAEAVEATPAVESVVAPVFPFYDGAQVVEVLGDDPNGQPVKRCRMSDGTTKDVPNQLFEPKSTNE